MPSKPLKGATVVFDLDGVIYDFMGHIAHLRDIPAEQWRRPQEYNELAESFGFVDNDAFWAWYQEEVGFRGVPLLPGASLLVRKTKRAGARVVFATNRPKWAWAVTAAEISRNFGEVATLVCTDDKTVVDGDLFIDDNPKVLKHLLYKKGWEKVICRAQPWNTSMWTTEKKKKQNGLVRPQDEDAVFHAMKLLWEMQNAGD